MPNKTIDQLTDGNPAQSADEIPIWRAGLTKKVTAGSVAGLAAQQIVLKTNGVANASQSLLDLTDSPSVTFEDAGAGVEKAHATSLVNDGVLTATLESEITGTIARVFTGASNFVGTGAAISFVCAFASSNYRVFVSYDEPTTNPGTLSVEYVSNVLFKIHSDSLTDTSSFRVFAIELEF